MSGLQFDGVTVRFGRTTAVDAVDLIVPSGSVVGLVGESGSGKSTLARAAVGLAPMSAGTITLDDAPVPTSGRVRPLQLVFQDPASALDPRMTVGSSVAEAMPRGTSRRHRRAEVARLLALVHLDPASAAVHPSRLSGGQRQRVALARALAAKPRAIIADEITSALDVSIQGAVLNVLRELQRELGLTMLFISHNLAVVRYVADQVAVMRHGRIVEHGVTSQVLAEPTHDYTRALLDAIPGSRLRTPARPTAPGRLRRLAAADHRAAAHHLAPVHHLASVHHLAAAHHLATANQLAAAARSEPPASRQKEPTMTRRPRIDDLTDIAIPSQPRLSPDGTTIAYVLRTLDAAADRNVDELWLVDAEGGAPRRLTRGPADTAPVWSPDGGRLAFLRDGQVAVVGSRGGEPEQVTDLAHGAGAPQWSPDGARLAFAAPVDPAAGAGSDSGGPLVSDGLTYQIDGAGLFGGIRQQLHVLDLDTGAIRVLTDGPESAGAPAWSPDGSTLAFTCRVGTDSDLRARTAVHVLGVDDRLARPQVVALSDGVAATVDWTPDGTALLVVGWTGDPAGHQHLLRVSLADGTVTDLSRTTDRNVMPGATAYPGGRPHEIDGRVWFCLRDHGCSHLWSVGIDGHDARPLLDGAGVVVSGLSIRPGRAAVARSTQTSYGEIAVVDLATGTTTVRTDHGAPLADVEPFPREERWFTSPDGTAVQGWLVHDPEQTGSRPVLLDIHGGPHNAWNGSADDVHLYHHELVAQGWAVLLVNPRGSDGYGAAFYDGVRDAWGVADAADFLAPLDQLVAEGMADPARLAVAGYSYGGFMACWLTGHDQRFAAAVAGGTVSDLVSMGGSSDDSHFLSAFELGGAPWEQPERYAEMSPLTHVGDVATPTLVIHGAADLTCPVGQAQQWHTALRERDVPTQLVVYSGASHAFIVVGRPSERLDYNRRVRDWLVQHVERDGRPAFDAAHWQRRLARLAERHLVPGAQLGILHVDPTGRLADEQLTVAHGVLNVRTGASVTTDAVFQIGSITKVWTATVAMALVDDGLLDLDAPVVEVLPELCLADPDTAKTVTLRHLLTHTSGIDGDVFTDTGRGDDCLAKYVELLADAAQNHPLGATWSYCNSGFSLIGRMIERVTGTTWDQAMRDRLYAPLGLTHTLTLPEEALLFAAALGHDLHEGEITPAAVWGLPRPLGPAGLITSDAADVLAFARLHLCDGVAVDGTRVLSSDSVAAMAAHQADLPDQLSLGDSWGLGWIRFEWDGHRLIGHDGNTIGQAAFLRLLPDQGLAVTLLTNGGYTRDLYEELYREIFAELAGISIPPAFAPPADPVEADVTPYVGIYERESVRMEVADGDDGPLLRTTLTGPLAALTPDPVEEYAMVPAGPALFAVRPDGAENWLPVTFYELPTGERYLHFGVRATPRVP